MAERHLFTSESVTEGHPDKVADQVSDSILDAIIAQDPACRVACETLVTTGMAFISAEIKTEAYVEIPDIARKMIRRIGYDDAAFGFDYETCAVVTSIDRQSPDIAMGVDTGGAGDQGLMFGFASDETPELMPLPISLAHKLVQRLAEVRKDGTLDYLRPDGKSQVTVEYEGLKPTRVDTVVLSTQHRDMDDAGMTRLREELREQVILPVLPRDMVEAGDLTVHINPTGRFVAGGPKADTGLTGRKIIVDTCGGMGSHGGGAFSGKDPSKVDLSASYAGRWVAKNIVAAGLASRAEVQLAYAIGVAEPVSVMVDTFGTGKIPDARFTEIIRKVFDLTPKGIIEALDLRRPIFAKTAAYGHFGRSEPEFTWERTDRVEEIKKHA